MLTANWRPFCLGLNVLTQWGLNKMANIGRHHFEMNFLEKIITGLDNALEKKKKEVFTRTNGDKRSMLPYGHWAMS